LSKLKSKQVRRRYSGPELPALLEQVATEHGSSVSITEVNKIRSGGVAGFFCREEFEVIVDELATAAKRAPKAGAPANEPHQGEDYEQSHQVGRKEIDEERHQAGHARFLELLEQRLDRAAITEASLAPKPAGQTRSSDHARPADLEPRDHGASHPSPELSIDLADDDGEVAKPFEPAAPPPEPQPVKLGIPIELAKPIELRTPLEAPAPSEVDAAPEAALQLALDEVIRAAPPMPPRSTRTGHANARLQSRGPGCCDLTPPLPTVAGCFGQDRQRDTFWSRLATADDQLRSLVSAGEAVTVIVGPLALALPITRRLQCERRMAPGDVTVLTNRAGIVSEPSWQLVRTGRQLFDVAAATQGTPSLLVVDTAVELPVWVKPLLARLRTVGIDLIRYVIPGTPVAEDLVQYRTGHNEPYAIDLVSRADPDLLLSLIRRGHPVATVGGVELSAPLVMAMAGRRR